MVGRVIPPFKSLCLLGCLRFDCLPFDAVVVFCFFCFLKDFIVCALMQVRTLNSPTVDEFRGALGAFVASFVYMLQGEELPKEEELGSLVLAGVPFSTPEAVARLFTVFTPLPTTVREQSFDYFYLFFFSS